MSKVIKVIIVGGLRTAAIAALLASVAVASVYDEGAGIGQRSSIDSLGISGVLPITGLDTLYVPCVIAAEKSYSESEPDVPFLRRVVVRCELAHDFGLCS